MTTADGRVCFVVMGFGKKTDYESGRTLDLDATYEAIIKPAVEEAGLRCIRADEITHSGVIDAKMYEMLLSADLVIADISTGNVNAIYELGVRHAFRPNATIIMKESRGKLYFDLDHVATFKYDHLGDDIGSREAKRAKTALSDLIKAATSADAPDSPVYTYLPRLRRPQLTADQIDEVAEIVKASHGNLTELLQEGNSAYSQSDFDAAVLAYQKAEKIKPQDHYILQRLALATYKSGKPSPIDALIKGLMIIEMLAPAQSNDPETLGITGAIRKRLWAETKDPVQLDAAINFYERGYRIRQDYYNGENLALCFDLRANGQPTQEEAAFDRLSANKTRLSLVQLLIDLTESINFDQRSDRKWIFATLSNCYYALRREDEGRMFEKRFYQEAPAKWEIDTYESSKRLTLENIPIVK